MCVYLEHYHGRHTVDSIVQRFENRDGDNGELKSPTSPDASCQIPEEGYGEEKYVGGVGVGCGDNCMAKIWYDFLTRLEQHLIILCSLNVVGKAPI